MSDLKVDGIIASTGTNTALTLQGKGSGKVDIGDGALSFPDADGDANQVIKTDGSGALSFATPASGAWALITDTTISADATINFTGFDDSTYSSYRFWLENVLPATDNTFLWLRTSTDGGSSYDDSASDYDYTQSFIHGDGTAIVNNNDDNAAQLIIAGEGTGSYRVDNGATGGVSGIVQIFDPGAATFTMLTWQNLWSEGNAGAYPCSFSGGGRRNESADVDAVRFLFASGNLTSGRILFEGLKK